MTVQILFDRVHHKFTEHAIDYPWSSYLTFLSVRPTHLHREEVIGWFDNQANFITAHEKPGDVTDLEKWLEL